MTDEQRLQMITDQLLIVRDNLFRGMSKSIQKLQARSINEVLELENFTQSPQQRTWVGLTDREIELIDGMIEVQLQHAMQCDSIANRTMADKQKGWDMERVALLKKLKAAHGIKENT